MPTDAHISSLGYLWSFKIILSAFEIASKLNPHPLKQDKLFTNTTVGISCCIIKLLTKLKRKVIVKVKNRLIIIRTVIQAVNLCSSSY